MHVGTFLNHTIIQIINLFFFGQISLVLNNTIIKKIYSKNLFAVIKINNVTFSFYSIFSRQRGTANDHKIIY